MAKIAAYLDEAGASRRTTGARGDIMPRAIGARDGCSVDASAKIVDIVLDCAFDDVSNFNRGFRTEFSASPLVNRECMSR